MQIQAATFHLSHVANYGTYFIKMNRSSQIFLDHGCAQNSSCARLKVEHELGEHYCKSYLFFFFSVVLYFWRPFVFPFFDIIELKLGEAVEI